MLKKLFLALVMTTILGSIFLVGAAIRAHAEGQPPIPPDPNPPIPEPPPVRTN